jgi:hypothetical protein
MLDRAGNGRNDQALLRQDAGRISAHMYTKPGFARNVKIVMQDYSSTIVFSMRFLLPS